MCRSQMRMFRLCVFSLKVHPGRIPLVGSLVTKSNYINLSANNDSDLRARQVGQPLQTSDHDNTRLLITIAPSYHSCRPWVPIRFFFGGPKFLARSHIVIFPKHGHCFYPSQFFRRPNTTSHPAIKIYCPFVN